MYRVAFTVLFLLASDIAQAIIIQVDYSYDAANGNFFGQVPAARPAYAFF